HRFALHEKHDEIGAVLSGLELSQIGGVSAYLVIVGQLDADALQQLGREGWPIAKELNQHFMRERRHHGTVSQLLAPQPLSDRSKAGSLAWPRRDTTTQLDRLPRPLRDPRARGARPGAAIRQTATRASTQQEGPSRAQ